MVCIYTRVFRSRLEASLSFVLVHRLGIRVSEVRHVGPTTHFQSGRSVLVKLERSSTISSHPVQRRLYMCCN